MGAAIRNRATGSGAAVAILGLAFACPPATAATSTITIPAGFNGRSAPGGIVLWFNSVVHLAGPTHGQPVTICVTKQVISWRDGKTLNSVRVPDATVSFKPWESQSWTFFGRGYWDVSMPSSMSQADTFMSGVAVPLPGATPPRAVGVTWTAQFGADAPVSLQWRGGAAAYRQFTDDYQALGVTPVYKLNQIGKVRSVDYPGTPLAFKAFIIAAPDDDKATLFTGPRSAMATVVLTKGGCGGAY